MSQEKIAVSKLGRAGKLVNAGAKVGANYMKHYTNQLLNKGSKDTLEEDNAKDIYKAFSELKGGPLKVAQMLSMGDQILPKAYVQQFSKAQNQVDPLSYPLVQKIIRKSFGKNPGEIFDDFSRDAANAASIGQVHKGKIGETEYAIKIQYPGVADSLQSDLRLIAPIATRMLGFKKQDLAQYLEEVEQKLLEETNYNKELENSNRIIVGCKNIEGIVFPEFNEALSSDRVITMTWIHGDSLNDWIAKNPSQELKNKIGQSLWDFYQHQIHVLKFIHADPHPGNFIVTPDNNLGVIDFGCMKEIPEDFYHSYTKLLMLGEADIKSKEFTSTLTELEMLSDKDTAEDKDLILGIFGQMFELVGKPFFSEHFDFSDDSYFESIFEQGESFTKDSNLRGLSARGSRHFIYFNRTYFGLYQLLNKLGAHIKTGGVVLELRD